MPEVLKLRQSSMHYVDPAHQVRSDARGALPHHTKRGAPDVVSFTELGALEEARIVRRRAKAAGYHFHKRGSIAVAVHPRHKLLELGHIDVLEPSSRRSGAGRHRARGIVEVTLLTPAGNIATVHASHWVRIRPRTKARVETRRAQSLAMVERVKLHGRGRRLSFWMGDTNADEGGPEREVQAPLTAGKLVSIYDALHTYPSTLGRRTIDVIGHYDPDARVRPMRVKVHKRRFSDHRMVDAWYHIRTGDGKP